MWEYLVKLFDKYSVQSCKAKTTEDYEVFNSSAVEIHTMYDVDINDVVLVLRLILDENGGVIESWYLFKSDIVEFNVSFLDSNRQVALIELVLSNGLKLSFEISEEKEDDEYGED